MDEPPLIDGSTQFPYQALASTRATYQIEGSHEAPSPPALRSSSADSSTSVRFACHFRIADPRKVHANAICARHTWPNIPRLKCVRNSGNYGDKLLTGFMSGNIFIDAMHLSNSRVRDAQRRSRRKSILTSTFEQRNLAR